MSKFSVIATAHAHTKSYSRHSSSSDLYQLIDLTDNGITHGTHKIGWLTDWLGCVYVSACAGSRANFHCAPMRTLWYIPSLLSSTPSSSSSLRRKSKGKLKINISLWYSGGPYFVHWCMCTRAYPKPSKQPTSQTNKRLHCTLYTNNTCLGWLKWQTAGCVCTKTSQHTHSFGQLWIVSLKLSRRGNTRLLYQLNTTCKFGVSLNNKWNKVRSVLHLPSI